MESVLTIRAKVDVSEVIEELESVMSCEHLVDLAVEWLDAYCTTEDRIELSSEWLDELLAPELLELLIRWFNSVDASLVDSETLKDISELLRILSQVFSKEATKQP